jgi:hypothetical protein
MNLRIKSALYTVSGLLVGASLSIASYRHTLWIDVSSGRERIVDSVLGVCLNDQKLETTLSVINIGPSAPMIPQWKIAARTSAFSKHSAYYGGTAAYALIKQFEAHIPSLLPEEVKAYKFELLSALSQGDIEKARSILEKASRA